MARILLVEDDTLVSMLAEQWLQDLGHVVIGPAADLASALKLAETPIDAAIVDVTLGRTTAYPLAEFLVGRGVPFTFATGYGANGVEPHWRGSPMLAKPFGFDELKRAVDGLLSANR